MKYNDLNEKWSECWSKIGWSKISQNVVKEMSTDNKMNEQSINQLAKTIDIKKMFISEIKNDR